MQPFFAVFSMSAAVGLATAHARVPQQLAVVELFTSEGCSSCPPAEVYLGELAQRPEVLALAFHVDYWDDLGWRDRFVIPEATSRQRGYARAMKLASVYTPQMVINGTQDFVGSDRAHISAALQRNRSGLLVQLSLNENSIAIDLAPAPRGDDAEVTLLAFDRSAVSHIGRGENAGRTLTEYNIVRAVRLLGQLDGHARTYHAEVSSLPKDATDVAVIVQALGHGAVLGAARLSIR